MKLIKDERYEGFELIDEKEIKEIEGYGKWFYHSLSGINVLLLKNQDPHKVFSINFATIPNDQTGAAHIVEHAVCCASQKYPLKETFMALNQGSICTTMNACTYPDRTMYYVASAHEKDLLGIATVFMDMVFHPKIEESSLYFLQEGWHYEYDEEENQLELSGVVYHEMLGEYSEATSYLQRYEQETLFPDTTYKYDSGGIPEYIVQLSEEAFLEFYRTHYVGANATITLYGNIDEEKFLEILDKECMQHINKGKKCPMPQTQKAFSDPHYTIGYYPTTLTNAPTIASLGFVVGESIDCEQRMAFELLEQMLLRSTASPLLKVLVMEEELGVSLSEGGYDSCRKQPVFSITLKGVDQKQALVFETKTLECLKEMVHKGLDPELIDAAIESLEFELKETDASYEPIGIVYSEMMLSSYLYGGNPFNHLCYLKALAHIKENRHKGYFENLIQEYLIENKHRSLTVVVPSESLQEEKDQAESVRLEEIKNQMSSQQLKEVIQMNQWLEEEQLKENEENLLKSLPQLSLADMPEQLEVFNLESVQVESTPVLFHQEETKDIIYFHFLWDVQGINKAAYRDVGMLAHVFSYIGTKSHTYSEIENKINQLSGGFHVAVQAYTDYENQEVLPTFKVSCKVMSDHLEAFMTLMGELCIDTIFKEKEKLKELIGHIVYEMERSFTGAPEYRATQRVYTYLCEQAIYEDQVAGLAFYEYIKDIYNHYDAIYEDLQLRLERLVKEVFKVERLKISVTASENLKSKVFEQLKAFLKVLPHAPACRLEKEEMLCYKGNEGFFNGQEGQAIAQGINLKQYGKQYKGQYEVVTNILENMYLWDRVRLQGGAYGCDVMLSREGYLVICSYCDPHLNQTLKVYSEIASYLKNISVSKEAIERAVVSTMGSMIAPISMEQKSERACTYFITRTPQEERQKIYDQIKQTSIQDFYEMSEIFEVFAQEGLICVLGNKTKLQQAKKRLKLIDLQI